MATTTRSKTALADLSADDRAALLAELEQQQRTDGEAADAVQLAAAAKRNEAIKSLMSDRDHLRECPTGRSELYAHTKPADPRKGRPEQPVTVVRCLECGSRRALRGGRQPPRRRHRDRGVSHMAEPTTSATKAQNAKLEHSDESGGETTRDDALDAGVTMLQGQPDERTGPEDALGRGEKRGDYRERVDGLAHEVVPNDDAGKPVTRWVNEETGAEAKEGDKGAIEVTVDFEPIGDAAGKKGGVDTDPRAAAA
jgi:hypothetical protein